MKIYIGHAAAFDYRRELYEPLKASHLYTENEVILPHDGPTKLGNKDFYRTIDVFVAEVSHASTGLGIELAWAHDFKKKILCLHRDDTKPSWSLQAVCDDIRPYHNIDDFLQIVSTWVKEPKV